MISSAGDLVLVDAGISYKQLKLRMSKVGYDVRDVTDVVMTHSHGDHVSGVRVLQSKGRVTAHGTKQTLAAARPTGAVHEIGVREAFNLKDLTFCATPTIHNASGAVTFSFYEGMSGRVEMLFETGRVTEQMWHNLKRADAVLVEANHDRAMLAGNEKIPEFLMQRIAATHLDNAAAAAVLQRVPERCRVAMCLHRSRDNNDPGLVRKICGRALIDAERDGVRLYLAEQDEPGEVIEL